MDRPVEHYWDLRLKRVQEALKKNNFSATVVRDLEDAKRMVLEQILPALPVKSVSWGGSMTFVSSGLYDALKNRPDLEVVDTYEMGLALEEMLERRRRSLLVDLFFAGTNAVTEDGRLVNLDMYGNRVAAITFGPRHVVLLVGRNKVVADVEGAMARVKNYAAPANAMRLDKKTPCFHTGVCEDCSSPERICNHWTITEKSFPKGRIHVVLINQDLGL
ncbi:MAG: lactate utilization protein [Desulfacinum sp.]|nr:lactate utilization protein [Desulfacinum sp.]